MKEATLYAVLSDKVSGTETLESRGDLHLLAGKWAEALSIYDDCSEADSTTRLEEKRGFCLARLARFEDAAVVLASIENDLSSAGLSALALSRAGDWVVHHLPKEEREAVKEMLERSLEIEAAPTSIAYYTYLKLFPCG